MYPSTSCLFSAAQTLNGFLPKSMAGILSLLAMTGAFPAELPLPPRHLPIYERITDGLSWSAHIDAELFSDMSGKFNQSFPDIAGQVGLEYDTDKARLWPGGLLTVSLLGIGSGGSEPHVVQDIQGASNIWATSLVRLYDFAYSQKLGERGFFKAGIFDVNDDFAFTTSASHLINSSFGIAPTMTANVPVATYPYSGGGAMAAVHGRHWNAKTGIFQGNPKFLSSVFDEGYMAIAEIGSHWRGDDEDNARYVFKGGAWHYEQGKPGVGNSTFGYYGVAERRWVMANHHLGAFLQFGAAPEDFNPVLWYLGLGVELAGFFPGRRNDSASFGMDRAWVRDGRAETVFEATYAAGLLDNVFLQPDLQYIVHPGGEDADACVGILRLHVEFF